MFSVRDLASVATTPLIINSARVSVGNDLRVNSGNILSSVDTTSITGSLILVAPFRDTYITNITSTATVTIPNANVSTGMTLTFRKRTGNFNIIFNTNSGLANFYGLGSLTPSTSLIQAAAVLCSSYFSDGSSWYQLF